MLNTFVNANPVALWDFTAQTSLSLGKKRCRTFGFTTCVIPIVDFTVGTYVDCHSTVLMENKIKESSGRASVHRRSLRF